MEITLQTKNRATIRSRNSTPGHISGENHNLKGCMYPKCSLKHCLQQPRHESNLNVHQCNEQIQKVWYIYTMEYDSGIKKEYNNTIYSNMDCHEDYHTMWSQTEKDKYCMISLTCRIFFKKWYKWTYLQKKKRLTNLEDALMVPMGRIDWECRVDM